MACDPGHAVGENRRIGSGISSRLQVAQSNSEKKPKTTFEFHNTLVGDSHPRILKYLLDRVLSAAVVDVDR
jgi:hypothetical protein